MTLLLSPMPSPRSAPVGVLQMWFAWIMVQSLRTPSLTLFSGSLVFEFLWVRFVIHSLKEELSGSTVLFLVSSARCAMNWARLEGQFGCPGSSVPDPAPQYYRHSTDAGDGWVDAPSISCWRCPWCLRLKWVCFAIERSVSTDPRRHWRGTVIAWLPRHCSSLSILTWTQRHASSLGTTTEAQFSLWEGMGCLQDHQPLYGGYSFRCFAELWEGSQRGSAQTRPKQRRRWDVICRRRRSSSTGWNRWPGFGASGNTHPSCACLQLAKTLSHSAACALLRRVVTWLIFVSISWLLCSDCLFVTTGDGVK